MKGKNWSKEKGSCYGINIYVSSSEVKSTLTNKILDSYDESEKIKRSGTDEKETNCYNVNSYYSRGSKYTGICGWA